eukprot:COSAG03_NODE_7037_length_972_cov_1.510882_2_plen_104_part_00
MFARFTPSTIDHLYRVVAAGWSCAAHINAPLNRVKAASNDDNGQSGRSITPSARHDLAETDGDRESHSGRESERVRESQRESERQRDLMTIVRSVNPTPSLIP